VRWAAEDKAACSSMSVELKIQTRYGLRLWQPSGSWEETELMSLSLYQCSVPVYERSLSAFLAILDKAQEHATTRKFDPNNYLAMRLSPDMWPLVRQVQGFCDHAKNSSFRLAGKEPPVKEDKETTIDELRARILATLDMLKSIDPKAMEGGETREIVIPTGANKLKLPGADYLLHFALPNFYFHLATAYDILRAGGVEIGKRNFMGAVPNLVRL
jgi:uncharacterized protein